MNKGLEIGELGLPEWQAHFDKHLIKAGSFEIPRPFIARAYIDNGYLINCERNRLPVFAGGLCPYGDRYFEYGKVWIFVLGKIEDHYLIDQRRIVDPTVEEYKKHFKKDVEQMTYFIQNSMNKALGEELSLVKKRLRKV